MDFQSTALPTELPRHPYFKIAKRPFIQGGSPFGSFLFSSNLARGITINFSPQLFVSYIYFHVEDKLFAQVTCAGVILFQKFGLGNRCPLALFVEGNNTEKTT